MSKLPRFMMAVNPTHPEPFAIIHTIAPIAIIGVHKGHIDAPYPIRHITSEGDPYTLVFQHLFVTDLRLMDNEEGSNALIDKLATRAWHWFINQRNDEED